MRFRLKTLLLAVSLAAIGATYLLAFRKSGDHYRGYFSQTDRIKKLVGVVDPQVTVSGAGASNGSNSVLYESQATHTLTSTRPITLDLVRGLREQLLNDLANHGIQAKGNLDQSGHEHDYPTARVRFVTWGFQVIFHDHGWKGAVTIRLTAKTIPGTESMGHLGELFENIVVFPRD
jgi:hypothetical protein